MTLTSVDTLRNAVAVAERKVQQDRTRVDQDARRLDDSRAQLRRNEEELGTRQQETRQAENAAATAAETVQAPRLERAFTTDVPPDIVPQLNAQGQTVGRIINIAV